MFPRTSLKVWLPYFARSNACSHEGEEVINLTASCIRPENVGGIEREEVFNQLLHARGNLAPRLLHPLLEVADGALDAVLPWLVLLVVVTNPDCQQ